MDDKKEFVENELKNALMKADSSIRNVTYVDGEFGNEWVCISYKGLTSNFINITGDSEIDIMYDVSRYLMLG